MNKKLLAIAVAAFVAAPAIATAQTTLYGQFKYEVGYLEDVAGDHNLTHSSKGTRLGIRGAEDLGGGLQGIFRFQNGFAQVNGTNDAGEVGLRTSRFNLDEEAWVGLQGGFGRLLLGRSDTAVKLASGPFRIFTDTLAEPSLIPAGTQRAEGIHYTTPSFSGATVSLTVEPNGAETDAYYALNAIYKAGPLFVSAAYESAADTGTYAVGGIGADQSNYQVGASWNFGAGDVGVLYQARNDGDDDVITIPVNYKVTPNVNLRAAAQYNDPDGGDDFTNFAIGAQYLFSSRTEAFVNIWVDDFSIESQDEGTLISNDRTNFGLGLRHSF